MKRTHHIRAQLSTRVRFFVVLAAFAFLRGAAHADEVMVFGSGLTPMVQLAADLTSLGHQVTDSIALPIDLSGFDVIWQVSLAELTPTEQTRLIDFVEAGGGLHLHGEYSYLALNASVAEVVNALVASVNFSLTQISHPSAAFNPSAVAGISTTPNALSTFQTNNFGAFLGGISGPNVLATFPDGSDAAAAWDSPSLNNGMGRLVVMPDSNWPQFTTDPVIRLQIIENLQKFLSEGVRPIVETVPTVSEWGLIAMSGLLLIAGIGVIARRRVAA